MTKSFHTLTEQRELLTKRGMLVGDEEAAERWLYNTNYYRISGYARQFQVAPRAGKNEFEQGVTFERVMGLLQLDDEFRTLLLEALTVVEISIRSRFAYEAGSIHGDQAFYLDENQYLDITPDLHKTISRMRSDLLRPKLATVQRYRNGDDLSGVPIWVAIESMTFGILARMIQYFDDSAASRATAHSLSLPWQGFQSTVHAFAVLRNLCAHHGQLWHRRLDITAPVLNKDKRFEPKYLANGPYGTIIALKRFMRAIDHTTAWPSRVDAHLLRDHEYATGIYSPAPR